MKRTRRSGNTVRSLILNSARALFSERGYAGATTREIAERAQVSEVLLFRHFTSKAQLFEESVFEPMDQLIRDFQGSRLQRGDANPGAEPETREYMGRLLELLSSNRHLLMALIAAESFEPEVTAGLKESTALRDYFKTAETYMKANKWPYLVDLPLGVRLSFATVLAAVLFQDWLFADLPPQLRQEKFTSQLTMYLLGGLLGSHGPKKISRRAPPDSAPTRRKAVPRKRMNSPRSER